MNIVILSIRLNGARQREGLAAILISKAADIQPPHIPLGMAVDDPLGHDLADAARTGQAMSTEGARHPEAAYGSRPEQELGVGCEAFGAIEKLCDLHCFHRGHALDD